MPGPRKRATPFCGFSYAQGTPLSNTDLKRNSSLLDLRSFKGAQEVRRAPNSLVCLPLPKNLGSVGLIRNLLLGEPFIVKDPGSSPCHLRTMCFGGQGMRIAVLVCGREETGPHLRLLLRRGNVGQSAPFYGALCRRRPIFIPINSEGLA